MTKETRSAQSGDATADQRGGWWVLVSSSDDKACPRAIGPYPSEEFCRLAAERMMPHEPGIVKLPSGWQVSLDADGKRRGGCKMGEWSHGPYYTAITGCVFIPSGGNQKRNMQKQAELVASPMWEGQP